MNQENEADFVTLAKEDIQKEYHTIDKDYIIINRLTNKQTDSRISLLLLIILLFVGSISVYAGDIFSSFAAIIWVYLFNVFYSHFNIYPDPLVNVHSSKNFIISNEIFGKNNQLYAMHFNSFIKSAIAQASVFVLAFADYFLYGFRNKITILYNIDFKQDNTPEIEFVATSTLLLIIVVIFNVRNILQVASASRNLGYGLYLNNIIFYILSFVCTFISFLANYSGSRPIEMLCFSSWFIIYIIAFYFTFQEGKNLEHDIVWNQTSDIYFTILLSNNSVLQDHVRIDSLAVIADNSIVLFDYDSNNIIKRKPSEISKIILNNHAITTEWFFDTQTGLWHT